MNVVHLFESLKQHLGFYSGLTEGALHIHIGLGLFGVLLLLFKLRPVWAFLIVLVAALTGEALDYYQLYSKGFAYPASGIGDFLNTIVWPGLITAYLYLSKLSRSKPEDPRSPDLENPSNNQ